MKNLRKRFLAGLLTVPFLLSLKLNISADESNTMYDNLTEATSLLEYLLKEDYEEVIDQIKDECISKNYDIETSLESIGQKDSIFSGADYVELMAAYMTISNNDLTIHDIDFISYDKEIESFEYIEPVKTYELIENEDGSFSAGKVKYITEEGVYDIVTKNDDGSIDIKEDVKVTPSTVEIAYGNYTLHLITKEELLQRYGNLSEADTEALDVLIAETNKRQELLTASGININGLSESIMFQISLADAIDEDAAYALEQALSESDSNTKALLTNAAALIGRVPYLWGGKPTKAGYDTSWWTIRDGKQLGLDCSGFVAWSYLSSGYSSWNDLYSTGAILANEEVISKEELQIGDLGLLNNGESINHVGIYIGNGYFIHCSSAKNTVTISKFPFTVFRRVKNIGTLSVCPSLYPSGVDFSDEDIYLLAQLVSHEAKGQGLNGWVAVTEVVLNRMDSTLYPNTLNEVIYQADQFEKVEDIIYEAPTNNIIEAVKATCEGRLKVLNDSQIMYFRNPPDGVADTEDWGDLISVTVINDHVFYKHK